MDIGFCMCGSFCTYSEVFPIMKQLADQHNVTPIFSVAAGTVDSRFGKAEEHRQIAADICGKSPLLTIPQVEPVGPKKLFDIFLRNGFSYFYNNCERLLHTLPFKKFFTA